MAGSPSPVSSRFRPTGGRRSRWPAAGGEATARRVPAGSGPFGRRASGQVRKRQRLYGPVLMALSRKANIAARIGSGRLGHEATRRARSRSGGLLLPLLLPTECNVSNSVPRLLFGESTFRLLNRHPTVERSTKPPFL